MPAIHFGGGFGSKALASCSAPRPVCDEMVTNRGLREVVVILSSRRRKAPSMLEIPAVWAASGDARPYLCGLAGFVAVSGAPISSEPASCRQIGGFPFEHASYEDVKVQVKRLIGSRLLDSRVQNSPICGRFLLGRARGVGAGRGRGGFEAPRPDAWLTPRLSLAYLPGG